MGEWCDDCRLHIAMDNLQEILPPWARTYFALHGKACPFEEE